MGFFSGKVVWITGASSGIGEALAAAFAKEGALLVLSSRREDELIRVKNSLAIGEEKCMIIPLDLASLSQIDSQLQQVIDKFGRIDILVNNGGISQRSLTKDTTVDIDRRIMEVNFFGAITMTKKVLPVMLRQKSGHIVVISSVAGKFGFYLRSAYAASKHALHGFFESLRMEVYNDNVQVLIVCPGKIHTNISVNALKADGSKFNVMDKVQEEGMPAEQCAGLILKGIEKGKYEMLMGGKEVMAVHLKRFFPRFFTNFIRRQKME
jgi:short-subunit dehydrogenase